MGFDLMESRRRIMLAAASSKQRIPVDYQEVEYLHSSGAYIVLDYAVQSENVKIETAIEVSPSNSDKTIIGNSGMTPYFRIGTYNYKWFIYNNDGSGANTNAYSATFRSSQLFTLAFEFQSATHKKLLTCNGTTTSATNNYSIVNERNVCLFINGSNYSNTFYGTMYYARFYEDGSKVLDLIPCYRKRDQEKGLYDMVNNVFYSNAGESGYFTAGPDV